MSSFEERSSVSNFFEDFPKKVRVGPFDVPVAIKDELEGGHWGLFNKHDYVVEFKQNQPSAPFTVDTAIHELLHAVWKISGVHKKDKEERIVSLLATGLTALFRDNPQILLWLIDSLHGPKPG